MPTLVASPRLSLSPRAMTLYAATAAVSFSATSSAPTPLYHVYQQTLGLSPLWVTVIFASYAFAMLAAFLTVARLSDYIGRKPMIFAALALNAIALVFFITAGNAPELVLARVVQGVATGIGMTTLGAAILDTDKVNGSLYNSRDRVHRADARLAGGRRAGVVGAAAGAADLYGAAGGDAGRDRAARHRARDQHDAAAVRSMR